MAAVNDIKGSNTFQADFVTGNAYSSWAVSLPQNTQLNFSDVELQSGKVNLFDHIKSFTPNKDNYPGGIVISNGIGTSYKTLESRVAWMRNHTLSDVPIFGHYNQSFSTLADCQRVFYEKCNFSTPSVIKKNIELSYFSELYKSINPRLLMVQIAHSEGGLIMHKGIGMMSGEMQADLSRQLIYLGFGPAEPLPRKYGVAAINIYSEKDYITKFFALKYVNNPDYDIRIVKCLSLRKNMTLYFADHDFEGETYNQNLMQTIKTEINERK